MLIRPLIPTEVLTDNDLVFVVRKALVVVDWEAC
jgi:hypothetical protein